ncbi:hypothetical protein B9Z55_028867 [Caenorhabditis nigoni]|uniref:Protein kinase domain-containing protein n=1 Tax=Caenorhabditis nigoni TaxID=1611254 RepID=A0A2G5SA23_9PELO|nr:hypothetical protein B9Z55_028867 [Caenorhabditis nigoni]
MILFLYMQKHLENSNWYEILEIFIIYHDNNRLNRDTKKMDLLKQNSSLRKLCTMNASDQDDYVRRGQILLSGSGSKFEIGEKLGSGAFGQVYQSRYTKKNGTEEGIVAVKLVKYEEGEDADVQREREILNLCAPVENVITLKKAFTFILDEQHFMLFAFEKYGLSLESMLKDRIINVPNTLKVGYIVLGIFEHLQKLGIVFRDLHPGQLLFCSDLVHMKLTDFGMAQQAKRNKNTTKEANTYVYAFDAASVAFLLVCCRTDAKVMDKPELTTSAFVNELRGVKDTLLQNNMMFAYEFVDELTRQMRGNLSYAKLQRALSAGLVTFDPDDKFILTDSVPSMLA